MPAKLIEPDPLAWEAAPCVFGAAPVASADPAADARRAASELAARLTRDVPEVDFGVGVSAGLD